MLILYRLGVIISCGVYIALFIHPVILNLMNFEDDRRTALWVCVLMFHIVVLHGMQIYCTYSEK